jgi:hypothetical protein
MRLRDGVERAIGALRVSQRRACKAVGQPRSTQRFRGCKVDVDKPLVAANNPALIAALTTTLPQYGLDWPAGRDTLLVVSVGSGGGCVRPARKPIARLHLIDHLAYMPPALLSSISEQQDTHCQILGHCIHGERIDVEVGALCRPSLLSRDEQKFTYVRYNTPLPDDFRFDDISRMDDLCKVGRQYALEHVKTEHLLGWKLRV